MIRQDKLSECMKKCNDKTPIPQDSLGPISFFSSDVAIKLDFKDWCKIIKKNNENLMRDSIEL